MKCCRCPLYHYWSNESDRGEDCAIFGDGWDSPFQYEDKEGTIIGCYLDRHFIEKADAERDEYYASMAESMSQYFKDEPNSSEKPNKSDIPTGSADTQTYITEDRDTRILDAWQVKQMQDGKE